MPQPQRTITVFWTDGSHSTLEVFDGLSWSSTAQQFRKRSTRASFVVACGVVVNLDHVRMVQRGKGWEDEAV